MQSNTTKNKELNNKPKKFDYNQITLSKASAPEASELMGIVSKVLSSFIVKLLMSSEILFIIDDCP